MWGGRKTSSFGFDKQKGVKYGQLLLDMMVHMILILVLYNGDEIKYTKGADAPTYINTVVGLGNLKRFQVICCQILQLSRGGINKNKVGGWIWHLDYNTSSVLQLKAIWACGERWWCEEPKSNLAPSSHAWHHHQMEYSTKHTVNTIEHWEFKDDYGCQMLG